MNHLMIDLETLGNRAGCIIASVAICAFDPVKGITQPGKTMLLDMDEQFQRGLTMNPGTVMFWMGQEQAAIRASFPEVYPKEEQPATARMWRSDLASELRMYFLATETDGESPIWSNPPQFDHAILEAYFAPAPFPFHFRSPRDCRTLFQLCPTVPRVKKGTGHDPLDDCYSQAATVINCYKHLGLA